MSTLDTQPGRRRLTAASWSLAALFGAAALALKIHITIGVMALSAEVHRKCHETRSGADLGALDSIVMMLAAVATVTSISAAILASRPLSRMVAILLTSFFALFFLVAWFGFAHRHDTIGPYCGG
ncbi:hypothetical protein ASG12_07625 [Williamsia sp. Leaf354]|uniref:hypothetical protein n=1 Tax=Williamsia sp. Leaf354 TaxID=1736349 RepID=UPI0006FD4D40|nr:hypothetical protein [Williamsia sp. Leaf354]KQS00723.1 hypothetical protein ASG12_07625 [Williamsia sp. Leaf354]